MNWVPWLHARSGKLLTAWEERKLPNTISKVRKLEIDELSLDKHLDAQIITKKTFLPFEYKHKLAHHFFPNYPPFSS